MIDVCTQLYGIILIHAPKHIFSILIRMSCYIYTYHDFGEKLSYSYDSGSNTATDGKDAG